MNCSSMSFVQNILYNLKRHYISFLAPDVKSLRNRLFVCFLKMGIMHIMNVSILPNF